MASYTELLEKTAERNGSISCFGMDPAIEKIPVKGSNNCERIAKFYSEILAAVADKIAAVKPNYAFFAQYGLDGLRAMEAVIAAAKKKKLPVILDAKRGDIGKSSEAYSKEVFGIWKADAVTVSPYMGMDSVAPFIQWCGKGKGVYVLVRTSNPGAADLQQLQLKNGKDVFMETAAKVAEWHKDGVGAVVGATNTTELERIAKFFAASGKRMPLLIPGVGSQGGSAKDVAAVLRKIYGNTMMHRINSSSAISYAYEKTGSSDYVGAAEKAVDGLNSEIGL
ncbi:orotidine-5'-phosphate decarboxylase [Candidatus Woesearchaeota archaeon]|nr:orotidine-5'-phosphate decarboxylase [Candidatus Woesearchaeota archaeon]